MIHIFISKTCIGIIGDWNSRNQSNRAALDAAVDIISGHSRPAVVWRRPVQRGRSVLIGRAGGLWRTRHSRYGRVKGGEHTHSAALSRNHSLGGKIIRSAVDAGGANAAILVSYEDAAFLIDGGIVEVEEVAAGTALTDAAALNRITGRDILRGPSRATVECSRDIQIPNASEVCTVSTVRSLSTIPISARSFGTVECKCGAIRITGHRCWERGIQYWPAVYHGGADIGRRRPIQAFIVRHRNHWVPVGSLIPKINGAVRSDTNGRVASGRNRIIKIAFTIGRRVGDRPDTPRNSVVFRNNDRLSCTRLVKRHAAAASGVRHINCAIRGRDLEVTMQTLAVGSGEHRRGCLAENKPAVVAPKRACVRHALRSVVDRILIKRPGIGQRRMEWATSECFVVNVGRNNAVARYEVITIVVSNVDRRTRRC